MKQFRLSARVVTIMILCLFAVVAKGEADDQYLPLNGWCAETAADLKDGKPLVITHYVALCDNEHQGIARVSKTLGDGDNLKTNLYWGAMFGYGTWFDKNKRWTRVAAMNDPTKKIGQILIYKRTCEPKGLWKKSGVKKPFEVLLVIAGYRGRFIADAVQEYLKSLFGEDDYALPLPNSLKTHGGGQGHVVSFSGHNYLMDLPDQGRSLLAASRKAQKKAKATMILACASKQYFHPGIATPKTSLLALTTNFMAPEAYTADAMYEALLAGKDSGEILAAAAEAYGKYQRIPASSAAKLFWSGR